MPPRPFITSAGWTQDGLISRGCHFLKIPRVSVSDKNLEVIIRAHEASGVPLVIDGMHKHRTWPTTIFNTQWLCENGKQQIQVRNVHNRRDHDVSFAEFMNHLDFAEPYASVSETSRLYAKDMDCPSEWRRWLENVSLVPYALRPHSSADIMQNLPERARVETLMCYLGPGDTFTPFHKDLCASFGHNLMCYTGNGASSFWFMTQTSDAWTMAEYLQSLGHELDLECHAMSVEELAAAPCRVYITEQKVGDLVLVPPRSCHQVVNHGGITMKMSWSRMTIKSAQIALHHELPIYRRVCRAETYCVKSTIHHTLRRSTALLEDLPRMKDGSVGHYGVFRKQLANDVLASLELFLEIMRDEYHPDAEVLGRVLNDFNHNIYDTEGYLGFICDFCGSDIFISFFCCKTCSLSVEESSEVGDGLHICPGCYVEGRSCRCGLMDPMQYWPLQILHADYNRAVRALKSVGMDRFTEIGDHTGITDNGVMGLFEAGTAIQKWRTDKDKDKDQECHARSSPHASRVVICCEQCHQSHCFPHLAEAGIHSSEAIAMYNNSSDQISWHTIHLSRTKVSNKKTILAAEVSGDGSSNLMGQKLALSALSFPNCQPLNASRVADKGTFTTQSTTTKASDAMDMSHPQDSNGWGSPLTEMDPEDSLSNTTLHRAATPPRVDGDHRKPSGLPPPTAVVAETTTKRKKISLVFAGVAPPARKRKTTSTPALPSPIPVPTPESVMPVKDVAQAPQSTSITLEPTLVRAINKIEELTIALGEQNKKIEQLSQDNTQLREVLIDLSQTFQLSKRDLQRVENTIPKLTAELKTKFEKLLEKAEDRIQGPIDRLLEELGRIRASPVAPVHLSSVPSFPQNTQFVPESQEGEGSCQWAPTEDYNPPGPPNKQHYQENCEPVAQPPPQNNNNYGRGNFRHHFRGRGRGSRGVYGNNRHSAFYPRPFYPPLPEGYEIVRVAPPAATTPAAAPLEKPPTPSTSAPAPAPDTAPIPASVSTPRHSDSYHSQGPPPPPPSSQHSQAHSHSYPQQQSHARAPPPSPPSHYDASPPPRHRPPRLQAYERDRHLDREPSPLPRPPSPARGTYTDRVPPTRSYRDEPPPPPTHPRSQSYVVNYRDDDDDDDARPARPRSEVLDDARYADDPASPVRSDEQLQLPPQPPQQRRWAAASQSVSPSEHAVHNRHRRFHDQQQRQGWRMPSSSRSRSTSGSRGYARRGPGDDVRGGRR